VCVHMAHASRAVEPWTLAPLVLTLLTMTITDGISLPHQHLVRH
jgi:hypothetical protein